MHVFTYGTLMFPQVWQAVVGRQFATSTGQAAGFQTRYVRKAVYPGMIAATPADVVQGIIYFDVDADSIARLDRFEDAFYQRQPITITCEATAKYSAQIEAEAYVVASENAGVLTNEPWSGDDFIARGELERFVAGFAGFGRVAANDS